VTESITMKIEVYVRHSRSMIGTC